MLMHILCMDTQPLQNMKVMKYLMQEYPREEPADEAKASWARHWIQEGLQVFEKAVSATCGKFCYGDNITLADVCLVPQVYNARRFGVDMSTMVNIVRIDEALSQVPAFHKSHPDQCPDAQK